ncbi:MAG: 2'-5' RNA ligase family protein, partial [Ilumatobacteraceae bacterium]
GLAERLGTPAFDPHITLATAIVDDRLAAEAVAQVGATAGVLDLQAGPTEHGPDRFRTLFVTFDDPRIHRLAADVCAALGVAFDPGELRPHLSLAYAIGLPADRRDELANAHGFVGQTLRFDALVANRSTGSMDDVARWHTFAVERLAPGDS